MKPRQTAGPLAGVVALTLWGALAVGGQPDYRAEIEQRRSRTDTIIGELRILEGEILAQEGRIQDFLVIHEHIEGLAAAAGGRIANAIEPYALAMAHRVRQPGPATALDPTGQCIVDPTGRMAAEASRILHPSMRPIRSAQEEAAVRAWEGSLQRPAFTFRNGDELIRAYQMLLGKFSIGEFLLPLSGYEKRARLIEELWRLQLEIVNLSILGTWRLVTQNNGSVIEVVRNPSTLAYVGILRLSKLQHFTPGATVFVVEAVGGERGMTFAGREFGYTNDGLPEVNALRLSIEGETMTYRTQGETLQWQRFVPWGEQRAPLGRPPPEPPGAENTQDF